MPDGLPRNRAGESRGRRAFFDAVVSLDPDHYFGNKDGCFAEVLKPVLKKGTSVAIVFPGMKFETKENILPETDRSGKKKH